MLVNIIKLKLYLETYTHTCQYKQLINSRHLIKAGNYGRHIVLILSVIVYVETPDLSLEYRCSQS